MNFPKEVGSAGSQPWQFPSCDFQKNPCFRFHLHLILLLPTAICPNGHLNMHVDALHSSSSPASNPWAVVGVPQFSQFAAARWPTGKPQSAPRCFDIVKASQYVGFSHSATANTGKIDLRSFLVSESGHFEIHQSWTGYWCLSYGKKSRTKFWKFLHRREFPWFNVKWISKFRQSK